MSRDIEAKPTTYAGITYRSRTEARWAVFLEHLGVKFDYETKLVEFSSGEKYLPDFYIHDFKAFLEVKPSSDAIVTEECEKARMLAREEKSAKVWLAMGAPSAENANILPRVSGILCVRHTMSNRSMYAKQEDHEGGRGRSGTFAVHSQRTH